ncbi:hypothetical protein EV127DRAFT_93927 [Xylaria flabelliformis]|nr:hypothetical protein EV127DRAFT_93927 [Xylaria flabelliformis]
MKPIFEEPRILCFVSLVQASSQILVLACLSNLPKRRGVLSSKPSPNGLAPHSLPHIIDETALSPLENCISSKEKMSVSVARGYEKFRTGIMRRKCLSDLILISFAKRLTSTKLVRERGLQQDVGDTNTTHALTNTRQYGSLFTQHSISYKLSFCFLST